MFLLLVVQMMISAQQKPDVRITKSTSFSKSDSAFVVKNEVPESEIDTSFKPDPVQNIWLGAVIPGYGQIANRKYWKLPIVYGGFMGCAFAITWNSKRYISYKNAYLDITDDDDDTNSFLDIIPDGYTMQSYGGQTAFTGLLKTGMDKSRYNRDLSVIVTVAYYGLTLIDAFVDAHLYDFDISPDLSMKIRPVLMKEELASYKNQQYAWGFKGSIIF
jgi:hypothetical protein